MRFVIFCSILIGASLGCDGERSVDPCIEGLLASPSGARVDPNTIADDSVVGAVLSWTDGGAPRRDLVLDLGMEIVHEFLLQPKILVAASGSQLRTLAQMDSTVTIRVTIGEPIALNESCR